MDPKAALVCINIPLPATVHVASTVPPDPVYLASIAAFRLPNTVSLVISPFLMFLGVL